jgi:environmental stress-induced protein Ves
LDNVLATLKDIQENQDVDAMKASWVDASGLTHEVVTNPIQDESAEDFAARHAERVEALKAIYPPA